MSVFDHPAFDGHEQVSFFFDRSSGLRAIIAIHNRSSFGFAGGGCRMVPYDSAEAALRDALRLSQAMTYKLALAELPAGGAKCVVIADPATDKSPELLRAIGRAVDSLHGRYVIAEDVGTTPDDMEVIAEETVYVAGRASGSGDTSPATGYGVFVGLREAVKQRLERDDLRGVHVAVQGVGHVGQHLCRNLARAGARLTVADIDSAGVRAIVDELGAEAVEPSAIYDVACDVFAPCALGGVLDDETIPRLRCAVVAGGANNQLAEPRHAQLLQQRSILYAPDFVINVGGPISAAQGRQRDEQLALAETERLIARALRQVFERARSRGLSTHDAAVELARARLSRTAHHGQGRETVS